MQLSALFAHWSADPFDNRGLPPACASRGNLNLLWKGAVLNFSIQRRAAQARAIKDRSDAKDAIGRVGHDDLPVPFRV